MTNLTKQGSLAFIRCGKPNSNGLTIIKAGQMGRYPIFSLRYEF
jgi:hypothetical protein